MTKPQRRIKSVILVVVLCIMTGGMSSLAWCLHLDDSASGHLVGNKTDHGSDHHHLQDGYPNPTHIESSCEEHRNDCIDVSFSQQFVTSNNTSSLNRIISKYNQPVTYLNMDWALFFPAANGQFRPPFKSATSVNQQLAALQTIVILH